MRNKKREAQIKEVHAEIHKLRQTVCNAPSRTIPESNQAYALSRRIEDNIRNATRHLEIVRYLNLGLTPAQVAAAMWATRWVVHSEIQPIVNEIFHRLGGLLDTD